MDVNVIAVGGGTVWHLTDLLGRSMGTIRENASHQFTIYPEGHAFETWRYRIDASLDAALAEIERHTRGVCRRSKGKINPRQRRTGASSVLRTCISGDQRALRRSRGQEKAPANL